MPDKGQIALAAISLWITVSPLLFKAIFRSDLKIRQRRFSFFENTPFEEANSSDSLLNARGLSKSKNSLECLLLIIKEIRQFCEILCSQDINNLFNLGWGRAPQIDC